MYVPYTYRILVEYKLFLMFKTLLPVPVLLHHNNAELLEVLWVYRNGVLSHPPKALILLVHNINKNYTLRQMHLEHWTLGRKVHNPDSHTYIMKSWHYPIVLMTVTLPLHPDTGDSAN